MDLNFTIKDIQSDKIDSLKLQCCNCTYWLEYGKASLFDDINMSNSLWQLIRSKIFEVKNIASKKKFINFLIANGATVKAVFSKKNCIGVLIAGKYYMFPRLKYFNFYPPDPESAFLSCLFVLPEYRNLGIGKKLLLSFEKDCIKNRISSIETVCKRLDDETDIDSYANSPVIPVKFLIKNGFYIKKNDPLYPLLRLDLSAIVTEKKLTGLELMLKNIKLEKAVKIPINKSD
jgi:GNAT superfamily N-acetyltransferase